MASAAIADLDDLPLRRSSHRPLLRRIWELRHVATPYDAAYVELAEALNVVLVTADARLARASGVRCEIEAIAPGVLTEFGPALNEPCGTLGRNRNFGQNVWIHRRSRALR
ncbi:MAG: hypothetical protein QOD59_877 [Mycobacterium sp.]|jgi:hypothetical protein|nr:hypothetical protein [Mycobacterium sp.]